MGDLGRKLIELMNDEAKNEEPDKKQGKTPVIVRLADVEPEDVEWLWEPYIPIGKLTLLEGDPGLGKTFLALQLASNISQGYPFLGQDGRPLERHHASSVVYMSAEDGLADTLRPRLDAAGADVSRVYALTGWQEDKKQGAVSLQDVEVIESVLMQISPRLIVIDPLQAYLGAGVDMHRANEVRPVLSALAALAEKYKCAVLCIRHLGKGQQDRNIYRGLGSIDFAAAARSMLLVGLNPNDKNQRVMAHVKSSLAPLGESIAYELVDGSFRWAGISEMTASQLLNSTDRDSEENSAFDEAVTFLNEAVLTPRPADEIIREAKNAGISERTLRRAKKELGIKAKRESIGNTGRGKWCWAQDGQDGQQAGKIVNMPLRTNLAALRKGPETLAGQGLWQDDQRVGMADLPEPLINKGFSGVSQDGQRVPLEKKPQDDQWEEL